MFNEEAFGYATNLPWKMFVPGQSRPFNSAQFGYYHPLFLYEALGNVLILVWLLYRENQKDKSVKREEGTARVIAPGTLFFMYLFLYNTLRFFIEFLRTDSTFIHGVRLNCITSGLLAIVGLIGLILINHRHTDTTDNTNSVN